MRTVGIDLGGTSTTAIVRESDGTISGRARGSTPTAGGRTAVLDAIADLVDRALDEAGGGVTAAGIGSPGAVVAGTVGGAANVPGWLERFDLAGELAERLGVPVRAANDVTAAAVGEHLEGAGRGCANVLVVFCGTGVGAGLVLDGRPFEGGHGAAGEFGQVVVDLDGPTGPDGRTGTVEAFAGRRALGARVRAARDAGRATSMFDIKRQLGKPRLTSSVWKRAVKDGDELAVELLGEAATAIGVGLANAVNLLDVERVVIGGGMAEKLWDWWMPRIEHAMVERLYLSPPRVSIEPAGLGDDSGAIGAALLAHQVVIG